MAKPRIFLSSTYYDMKTLRLDIERFVKQLGYDCIRNEKGNIPYQSGKKLEESCYKEIELCDILVSIVGGKYGSPSMQYPYSISQKELKTALELGKSVYIFIEKNVNTEYRTYQLNKDIANIKYSSVDDIRIYKFIEEIVTLPIVNPIASFETSEDIIDYLKEQWAGLFQRMLEDSIHQKEVKMFEDINKSISTLNQLVNYLTEDKRKGDQAIKEILLSNHPIFDQLKKVLNVQYRVYFINLKELNDWLPARSCTIYENPNDTKGTYYNWLWRVSDDSKKILQIKKDVFDEDGKLRVFTNQEWDEACINIYNFEEVDTVLVHENDDLPF